MCIKQMDVKNCGKVREKYTDRSESKRDGER
jgi:hypothetical protein